MPLLTRRNFLLTSVGSIFAAGAYAYGRWIERTWLDIVHLDLPLRRLPDGFAGFRIVQISDLHFGAKLSPDYLESVIDEIIGLNPDTIVITGDIVSSLADGEADWITQSLSRLRAPHGIHAVLGNHDWWENALLVTRSLTRANINVLSNMNIPLQRDGGTLYLAGVDDVWCGKHELTAALRGIPSNAGVVALVHEPDYADTVAHDERVILQLSGHSHGGQVRVPFTCGIYFPPWGRKYPMGLNTIDGLTLYTNRGIGVVNRPVRFACRPEVTLFTLRPMG